MQSTLQEHYNISETNRLEDRSFTQENKSEDEVRAFLLLMLDFCFMFYCFVNISH